MLQCENEIDIDKAKIETSQSDCFQASALNGLMDHWEERSKQPGVAGIAKYMAAFIRFALQWN